MAEDSSLPDGLDAEDLDATAERLEAALERIALKLDTRPERAAPKDLAARVDGLIARIRETLAASPFEPEAD